MSHVHESAAPEAALGGTATRPAEPTLGTLVSDLTSQIPDLIRSEIRLAQAEMTEKGKRAGIGLGMFSAAGLLALLGLGTLVATLILVLDVWLPAWAAALIVTALLFAIAGIAAVLGKKKVSEAGSPKPERAIANVKQDVAAVKEARS